MVKSIIQFQHLQWAGFIKLSAAAALAFGMNLFSPLLVFADQSHLKLRDDFEGETLDAAGGLYYKDNEEQRAGTLRTQSSIFRSGQKGLALTVVPRCEADRRNCSERAEVWERTPILAGYDKAVWYALSVKLDDPPPVASHRYVIAQWKRQIKPNAQVDYSPFLALRLIQGHLALTIDSDAMQSRARSSEDTELSCAHNAAPAMQRTASRQTRLLIATSKEGNVGSFSAYNTCTSDVVIMQRGGTLPKANSEWIDFVFKVKPGPSGNGEIEVFANKAWVVSVKGKIGHDGPALGLNQYFKFGPYRDGGQKNTWTVFYDDFRRGPTCEDVTDHAICNQAKAP